MNFRNKNSFFYFKNQFENSKKLFQKNCFNSNQFNHLNKFKIQKRSLSSILKSSNNGLTNNLIGNSKWKIFTISATIGAGVLLNEWNLSKQKNRNIVNCKRFNSTNENQNTGEYYLFFFFCFRILKIYILKTKSLSI